MIKCAVLLMCVCAAIAPFADCAAADLPSSQAVSLSLTGLTVAGDRDPAQISFSAERGHCGTPAGDAYIGEAVNQALGMFFLGLCIPDEAFWVNLSPANRSRSIDPVLADTDLGKILLAADLSLKKDTSSFTNPRTSSAGRQYWDRLYAKASALGVGEMPIANRVWITPGAVRIREDAGSATILESSLQVCLEADYMPGQEHHLTEQQKQLQEYARELMRQLIIPALNKKVNEAPTYETLRQAFRAIVLARWYKKKFAGQRQWPGSRMIADVQTAFPSRLPYHRAQIEREYLASLQQGDYNFSGSSSEKLSSYMELITRRYFSGGIDWRSVAAVSSASSGPDRTGSAPGNFFFSLRFDMRAAQPAHDALASIRVIPSGAPHAEAGVIADLETELPPTSAADTAIKSIMQQGQTLYRVMSRNL